MTDMLRLYEGDCFDIFPGIPTGSVDLVLCDLPYGATQNAWDVPLSYEALWAAYRRLLAPKGVIVLTATQPFASHLISTNPTMFRYDLVWRKNKSSGFLNAKKQPLRQHEQILVFYERQPTYNPQMTTGHAPGNKAVRVRHSTNYNPISKPTTYGGSTERYPTSVVDIPVLNNDSPEREHSTQKPVELMAYLVRTYTNEGDTVLDNCMGSGTTGVACAQLGRKFIGIEKFPEFFATAQKRLGAATRAGWEYV